MTTKEMSSLNIGDTFYYAGQEVTIVDWQCLEEPQFNQAVRVDAEPLVQFNNGRKTLVTWPNWPNCQLMKTI